MKAHYNGCKVKLVLDHLNTHFPSTFYKEFLKQEADRALDRISLHPKHGSWLNMGEMEINVMDRECLTRRIGGAGALENEISCWARKRNEARKKIKWSFTRQEADHKLSNHYVA